MSAGDLTSGSHASTASTSPAPRAIAHPIQNFDISNQLDIKTMPGLVEALQQVSSPGATEQHLGMKGWNSGAGTEARYLH